VIAKNISENSRDFCAINLEDFAVDEVLGEDGEQETGINVLARRYSGRQIPRLRHATARGMRSLER
jgi:hypothetical protein